MNNPLYFFTDITTNASNFCMLNIKHYTDKRKKEKELIFIDPSVYELKNSIEYSKIELLTSLVPKLELNEYISIDYPSDLNPINSELFIEKSIKNNFKFQNFNRYICTIQSNFMDLHSFIQNVEYLKQLWIIKPIIGIGNLCRILRINNRNRDFCYQIFNYIYNTFPEKKWLHFYGLSVQLIETFIPKLLTKFKISTDSTKWTKSRTSLFKQQNGVCCRKKNRDKFFLHYMNELQINNLIF